MDGPIFRLSHSSEVSPLIDSALMKCAFISKAGKACPRLATPGASSVYCPVHQPLTMQDNRVQCEVCHQWVRADSLRHKKVCSGYTSSLLPFYARGVNARLLEEGLNALEQNEVVAIPEHLYYQVVNKVQFLYDSFVVPRLERDTEFDPPGTQSSGCDKPDTISYGLSEKHRSQERSITNIMEEVGLVGSSAVDDVHTCFVDFGAGKGSLSKALYQDPRVREERSLFVLVERDAQKHKAELAKESRSYRARIDLADVDLLKLVDAAVTRSFGDSRDETCGVKIDATRSSRRYGIVGIGKHLCGSATDLALAALKNASISTTTPSPYALGGVCIALCCHSKISWECLASRTWLEEVGGITHAEFELIRKWSGFTAVDAQQRAIMEADEGTVRDEKDEQLLEDQEPNESKYAFPWRDYAFRERLGRMCKRVIDVGRVHFIEQSLGMQCRLVTYVSREVTPENVVLVAYSTNN